MPLSRDEALQKILEVHKSAYLLNIPSVQDALMEFFAEEVDALVRESRRYNYLFSISFSVDTDICPDDVFGDDPKKWIPVEDLEEALQRRIRDVTRGPQPEIYEAIGYPEDHYDREEV